MALFHIVNTDNFGSDYPDEKWVAQNIPILDWAVKMATALNVSNEYSRRYFKVVEDGYKLVPGFEP